MVAPGFVGRRDRLQHFLAELGGGGSDDQEATDGV